MRRIISAVFIAAMLHAPASARDDGQWDTSSPELRAWFNSLKQPDNGISCCGDYDLYYADEFGVEDGKIVATITDSRGHLIPVGTRIVVPPEKFNRDANRTGHTLIFLGMPLGMIAVFCFIPSAGV